MKILNLYAGIGGNRKLWDDTHRITAVEWDKEIAAIYSDFYPNDEVIVADAHHFLLEHYKEYDFIWSSPPCPSHSSFALVMGNSDCVQTGNINKPTRYPDMSLYQEIILLQHYSKCNWIVENVMPFYTPLISARKIGRHLFWSNFNIPSVSDPNLSDNNISEITGKETHYGFNIADRKIKHRKDQILRNLVNPEIGKYLLDIAVATPFKHIQEEINI